MDRRSQSALEVPVFGYPLVQFEDEHDYDDRRASHSLWGALSKHITQRHDGLITRMMEERSSY